MADEENNQCTSHIDGDVPSASPEPPEPPDGARTTAMRGKPSERWAGGEQSGYASCDFRYTGAETVSLTLEIDPRPCRTHQNVHTSRVAGQEALTTVSSRQAQ